MHTPFLFFCAASLGLCVVAITTPWSVGGLFLAFGLFELPLSFVLLLSPLWGILWPPLPYLVIVSIVGMAISFILSLVGGGMNSKQVEKGCYVAIVTLTWISTLSALAACACFLMLTIIPPGLWGGRWGMGAISCAVAGILASISGATASRHLALIVNHPAYLPQYAAAALSTDVPTTTRAVHNPSHPSHPHPTTSVTSSTSVTSWHPTPPSAPPPHLICAAPLPPSPIGNV